MVNLRNICYTKTSFITQLQHFRWKAHFKNFTTIWNVIFHTLATFVDHTSCDFISIYSTRFVSSLLRRIFFLLFSVASSKFNLLAFTSMNFYRFYSSRDLVRSNCVFEFRFSASIWHNIHRRWRQNLREKKFCLYLFSNFELFLLTFRFNEKACWKKDLQKKRKEILHC